MKTFSTLILSLALISATATGASAYHFSPNDTKIALRGAMTFYPGGQQPFKCKVTFYLKTKGRGGIIRSVKIDHISRCSGLGLGGLPWYVGIGDANSGQFGTVSFTGGGGGCSEGAEVFTVNYSGIWKLPSAGGQCMSGTLTSHPPVTIMK